MTEKHLTNQRFTDFSLAPELHAGLAEIGFEFCTPIQAQALPLLLGGKDVAGQAKTGTGKTGAFLVALFQYLNEHPGNPERTPHQPRALILAPTRELAIQIDKDAEVLSRHMSIRSCLVYGGTGYESQRRRLQEGVDLLVGTPGRVIDYYRQGVFSLDAVQVAVLDEADRMFDLGFIKDIRYLLRRMPPPDRRLNMLFSATLSLRVSELAYEHMNQPEIVRIESERLTVDEVRQSVYFPSNEDKLPLLLGFLDKAGETRSVVFVNTKHVSERVCAQLLANEFNAGVLSGDVPQKQRERLLDQFKAGQIKILVATDVAARGLHIPEVSHVFNYDLPQDPEDYVHRIGRTARAGAEGDAVSFACENFAFSLPEIEDYIGHKIDSKVYSRDLLADLKPVERAGGRVRQARESEGRRSKRPRKHESRDERKPRGERKPQNERKPGGEEESLRSSGPTDDDRAAGKSVNRESRHSASQPDPVRPKIEIPAVG